MRPSIPYRLKVEIGGLYDWGIRIGTQKIELTVMQKASMEAAIGKAVLDPSPFSPLRTKRTTAKGGFDRSERDRFKPPSTPLSLSAFAFKDGIPCGYFLAAGDTLLWSSNRP